MVRLALLLWIALACSEDVPPPPPPVDAGMLPECACTLAPAEDCLPCFEQIGRCCYEDVTIENQVEALVATCESDDRCKACCDECAALSCDQLKAQGNCVNLTPM